MFEVLPLSPVREWASSRSFIAYPSTECTVGVSECAREQHRGRSDDIARRFENPTTGRRAIGVKRFDLVADSNRLTQAFGAARNAQAHLVGLLRQCSVIGAVQGIDADQLEAPFARRNAGQFQPLANDLQAQ